jgi:hypothetical protein
MEAVHHHQNMEHHNIQWINILEVLLRPTCTEEAMVEATRAK